MGRGLYSYLDDCGLTPTRHLRDGHNVTKGGKMRTKYSVGPSGDVVNKHGAHFTSGGDFINRRGVLKSGSSKVATRFAKQATKAGYGEEPAGVTETAPKAERAGMRAADRAATATAQAAAQTTRRTRRASRLQNRAQRLSNRAARLTEE